MEKLYRSQDLIPYNKKTYKIFHTITRDNKMYGYSSQFYALNDYAYFVTQSVNDVIAGIDNKMNEINNWLQNPNLDEETIDDFVTLYLGEEEDRHLWIPLVEQISINTIIMCLLSFCEGTLKEITFNFINKRKIYYNENIIGIDWCIKKLKLYDKKNLLKEIEKDILLIKKAKKIRNKFVHEQWMTIRDNVWDFKTRKDLNKISIKALINAITNLFEVVERIGIDNGIYKVK